MPIDPMSNQGCERQPPPELLRGIGQFNHREYFECHETLEALWNIERAQAAQASKATDQGTSGIVYCDNLYKGILQVDVGWLIADARRLRAELATLGPERFEEVDLALLPIVRVAGENHASPAQEP